MKYLTANGTQIPVIGFGTFRLGGNQCVEAVNDAITIGYRHFDTAVMYGNEAETGEGIRRSGINRHEIFITTKLWTDSLAPRSVRQTTSESLKYLKTDYIDLLLIHWPSSSVPLEDTLEAMNELRLEGKVRFLGVSNFTIAWMEKVEKTGVPVITNQVEYHALLSQEKLLNYLKSAGMFLTAYSPLAKGRLAYHPVMQEIGRKHNKTGSQIALGWLVQQEGVSAIPKASSSEKRRKNFDIFNFQLDSEDLERIALLEKDQRLIDIPGMSPDWD